MDLAPTPKTESSLGKSKTEVLTFWGFGIWVEGTVRTLQSRPNPNYKELPQVSRQC